MVNEYLATYLNDHLAGSVAAVELLERLEAVYPGTDMARFFAALRNEIVADRGALEELMTRLQIAESRPRKASAWIAGKFTELKLRLDDKLRGPLRLLESLEAVGLGIDGKLALWRALNAATSVNPALQGILDYERLEKRAEEQREAVEIVRLEAARAAFKQVQQAETAALLH
jgi:hypothetical protein